MKTNQSAYRFGQRVAGCLMRMSHERVWHFFAGLIEVLDLPEQNRLTKLLQELQIGVPGDMPGQASVPRTQSVTSGDKKVVPIARVTG
jgi:hypothetical protein